MKFFVLSILSAIPAVLAQVPGDIAGESIPADLQTYADGLLANPTAVAALEGIYSNPAWKGLATATATGTALVNAINSAFSAGIAAEPTSLATVAASILTAQLAIISTDGVLSEVATETKFADVESAESSLFGMATGAPQATPTIMAAGAAHVEINAALVAAGILAVAAM